MHFKSYRDDFFNKIQPIASRIPYMVTAGNHEFWYNFSAYKNRFFMPGVLEEPQNEENTNNGSGDNMYFSWNLGPIHFISMNSETAIDVGNFADDQIKWIEKDLQLVDRTSFPWILANFHRPLYCSYGGDCSDKMTTNMRAEVEDLLNRYNVNIVLTGHVHAYERTYEVYNSTLQSTNYDDSKAPVYLLQGASGNREGNKGSVNSNLPDWSAVQYTQVGFGLLNVKGNGESVNWSFIESETNIVLDGMAMKRRE